MSWHRFWQRNRRDEELARELESYLAPEADARADAGLAPEEARSAALRKLGNATAVREEVYRMNSLGFVDVLRQDVRYAVRTLYRTPVFASVSILALALGIGANTAIFTAVDAVLLRPLSYPDADRLVMVWEDATHQSFPRNNPAPANYFDWRRQNRVFTDMAAVRFRNANLTGDGPPEMVLGRGATANLFAVMGVQPMLGRAFTAEEDQAGARVVVLSYGLWQRRYGGDPGLVGRTIQMNGEPYTVVGVMPRSFHFPDRQTVFFWPSGLGAQATQRGSHYLTVVARLKPGVAVAGAQT